MKATDVIRAAAQKKQDDLVKEIVESLRKLAPNKTDKQLTRIAKSMIKEDAAAQLERELNR